MPSHVYYFINIAGGLALFLYGVSQSTEAFRTSFSTKTRDRMSLFTQKKPQALLFGAGLAALTQGSTVSTSIAISFVDVGMLTLVGSVVVMMGASIGGTFVTLLISLDIVAFSPLLMAVSLLMLRIGRGWAEKAGNILQALSLILMGMLLLKMGVNPLLDDPAVRGGVAAIVRRPFTMFVVSVAGTVIFQSSASVMALAVTMAISGAFPMSAVYPVAMGSHLGSTVTMLLAATGGRRNARLLGVATFLYKLIGVVAFLPLLPWANRFLDWLVLSMPLKIVLAQVLLVILNAAIFYPWPQVLIKMSVSLLFYIKSDDLRAPVYLDDKMLEISPLALRLLAKEMVRLSNYIEAYLQMLLYPEKGGGELKKQLPDGIRELTEACEQYMYEIRPPSIAENPEAEREYRTISYAMVSIREVTRIITGRFRTTIEETGLFNLSREMGREGWKRMSRAILETVRDGLHAFALGDADLAQDAIESCIEFEEAIHHLKGRMLMNVHDTGRRGTSSLIDFVTAANRLVAAVLEVARGDAARDVIPEHEEEEAEDGGEDRKDGQG